MKKGFVLIEQIERAEEGFCAPVARCLIDSVPVRDADGLEAFVRGWIDGFIRNVYNQVREAVDWFDMPYEGFKDGIGVEVADIEEIADFLEDTGCRSFNLAAITTTDGDITDHITVSKI